MKKLAVLILSFLTTGISERLCLAGPEEINAAADLKLPEYRYDINKSHQVDIFDLVIVGQQFGKTAQELADSSPDVNQDGKIDLFDLVLVGNHFGETLRQTEEEIPSEGWKIKRTEALNSSNYVIEKIEEFFSKDGIRFAIFHELSDERGNPVKRDEIYVDEQGIETHSATIQWLNYQFDSQNRVTAYDESRIRIYGAQAELPEITHTEITYLPKGTLTYNKRERENFDKSMSLTFVSADATGLITSFNYSYYKTYIIPLVEVKDLTFARVNEKGEASEYRLATEEEIQEFKELVSSVGYSIIL